MTRMRAAAVVAVAVTALGVGSPVTAQAAKPATYTCATVSDIFYGLENFVSASGCQGPISPHGYVALLAVPPGVSRFCTWGEASGAKDDLDVTGHLCV